MGTYKQQSHVVWQCNYHIVWCPKYRFRVLTGLLKDLVEHDIKMLCQWKGCEVEELSVQSDHIHMLVSIPPKVSVSELMGFTQGKASYKAIQELSTVEAEAVLGQSFLVTRLLCQYHWS